MSPEIIFPESTLWTTVDPHHADHASASISTSIFWIDQRGDFDHRRGGADVAKEFAVGAADFFPVGNVGDEHARAHDVFHAGAGLLQGRLDVVECLHGLRVGVAGADDFPSASVAVVPATCT